MSGIIHYLIQQLQYAESMILGMKFFRAIVVELHHPVLRTGSQIHHKCLAAHKQA